MGQRLIISDNRDDPGNPLVLDGKAIDAAAKDPQAMALLLEKGRTQKQQLDIANRLINYLGSLGVSVGKSAVTPALNYLSDPEARPAQTQPTAPGDAALLRAASARP
jgi:hypothetical protein